MRTFIKPTHKKTDSNSLSNFWANGNSHEVETQERVHTANWNEASANELPRHEHQGSGTYILEQADNDSHNSRTEEYQLQDNSKYSVEDIKLTIQNPVTTNQGAVTRSNFNTVKHKPSRPETSLPGQRGNLQFDQITRTTGGSVFQRKYARININRNMVNYNSGRDFLQSPKSGGVKLLASSYELTKEESNQQPANVQRKESGNYMTEQQTYIPATENR